MSKHASRWNDKARTSSLHSSLTMIHAPNGIGSYAHAFAMTDDSNAATEVVRYEIDSLRDGERDYSVPTEFHGRLPA